MTNTKVIKRRPRMTIYEFTSSTGSDKGVTYTWRRTRAAARLSLELPSGWDTPVMVTKVRVLEPGQSIKGRGGVLKLISKV